METPRRPVPPAPREPSQRARELIYSYQGAQFVLLIIGIIFLPLGLTLGGVFGASSFVDVFLGASPHDTDGHVLESHVDYHVRINNQHPTRITFSYNLDGTDYQTSSLTRDRSLIGASSIGATVPVEYVGWHPGWARLRGTNFGLLGPFGLLFFIFPTVGALMLFFAVRSNRREIHAFVNGKPTTARVVFAGPDTSVRINGRNPIKIAWELTVDGVVYEGSVSSLKTTLVEDLLGKKEIVVVYDEANPKINTVWVD